MNSEARLTRSAMRTRRQTSGLTGEFPLHAATQDWRQQHAGRPLHLFAYYCATCSNCAAGEKVRQPQTFSTTTCPGHIDLVHLVRLDTEDFLELPATTPSRTRSAMKKTVNAPVASRLPFDERSNTQVSMCQMSAAAAAAAAAAIQSCMCCEIHSAERFNVSDLCCRSRQFCPAARSRGR